MTVRSELPCLETLNTKKKQYSQQYYIYIYIKQMYMRYIKSARLSLKLNINRITLKRYDQILYRLRHNENKTATLSKACEAR